MLHRTSFCTISEAAELSGLPEEVMRKAIRGKLKSAPRLPCIKVGRHVLLRFEYLVRWIVFSGGEIKVDPTVREDLIRSLACQESASRIRAQAERAIEKLFTPPATENTAN